MDVKQNDLVVVPGLGVGRVEGKEQVDIGSTTLRAFCVTIRDEAGKVWIPEDRTDGHGLRAPMDEATATSHLQAIAKQEAPKKRANWRNRQRRYEQTIASNEPGALAKMIGELLAVQRAKKQKKQVLSFGERRLLDRAKNLLFGEVAAVTGKAMDALERSMGMTASAA